MKTVILVSRVAGSEPVSFSVSASYAKAALKAETAYLKSRGYNVVTGSGFLTATHPETGKSLTCTILKA